MGDEPEPSARLDALVQAHPIVVGAVLLLFLLTTFLGLISYGRQGWSLVDKHFFWQDSEYDKLAGLHSDYTVQKFEEILGAPLLSRRSENWRWTELFFRGRGYWVQAVVPTNGDSVTYFSVTSCSRSFRPTFQLPEGRVTLFGSTLASAGPRALSLSPWPIRYRYAVYASIPPSYFDWYSGGHAWNFKGFAWEFNGVCGGDVSLANPYATDFFVPNVRTGRVSRLPREMRTSFRESVTVNTYAEWGPSTGYPARWPPRVPLGVDESVAFNN